MTPTNGQYMVLADLLGDALDRCAEVRFYGDSVFVAHKALRIAANMPSEKELAEIIHTARWDDGDPHLVYKYPFSEADNSDREVCFCYARAILKRLGAEK